MVAEIEANGVSLRTGTPVELFKGAFLGGVGGLELGSYVFADYDVAPDGSRVVMFPKPTEIKKFTTGMVTIVSNWFDDLTRATSPR